MWYGLKVGEQIIAVQWFPREPEVYEFAGNHGKKGSVSVVVVRVREVSTVS